MVECLKEEDELHIVRLIPPVLWQVTHWVQTCSIQSYVYHGTVSLTLTLFNILYYSIWFYVEWIFYTIYRPDIQGIMMIGELSCLSGDCSREQTARFCLVPGSWLVYVRALGCRNKWQRSIKMARIEPAYGPSRDWVKPVREESSTQI